MKWLTILITLVLLIVLPFWLVVRGAVLAHTYTELNGWLVIVFGLLLAVFCLFLYGIVHFRRHLWTKRSFIKWIFRLSIAMVVVYGVYALVFISLDNVKQPNLVSEYRQLHPILRISLATMILIDRRAVMTDATRVSEDYERMRLPQNLRSLHYQQADGFVYAVDIRTVGRSRWRIALMTRYFSLMGIPYKRHVGTADHLHVYLVPNKNID